MSNAENTLVSFISDARCYESCPEFGMQELIVSAGNVGILVSEYCKDPTFDAMAFEVLVGDRILFDVDRDTFKELKETLC
tara:strand:+ start:730 stop:969 length:240 start_codon:yes stop_codon:yes gene_type:complete